MTTQKMTRKRWVLVPGTLCTPAVFAGLLDSLGIKGEDCHFITVDEPAVQDYNARLGNAVSDGDIVCGFSLGAIILAHNLDALAKARAVVLLALNPEADTARNRVHREIVRDRILAGDASGWVNDHHHDMFKHGNERLHGLVASMAVETSHLISIQTELAATRPCAVDTLTASRLPLVFVTGSDDRLTPPARIRDIAERARYAAFRAPEALGHYALLEAPGRVAEAILHGLDHVTGSS